VEVTRLNKLFIKNQKWPRTILLGIGLSAIIAMAGSAIAQEYRTTIDSNPPGAFLTLEGEYRISATSPCRIPDNIVGNYRLKARLPGYESWSGDVLILPNQDNTFALNLSPKTRLKASLRSLIIPGWGQYYSGQKSRSLLISLGTIGAGIGALVADNDYRRKRDDYYDARIDLANARTSEEIDRLWTLARTKNRDAYNAETTRNTLTGLAIGMWVYNVLDAMIFFPEHKLLSGLPKVQADFSGDKAQLKLTAAF
jgi:Family of unknown function (DUF5683)/PEGA domain